CVFRALHIRNCSKWGRVERRVRRRVIDMVQDIRRLSSDLKAHSLLDPYGLRERHRKDLRAGADDVTNRCGGIAADIGLRDRKSRRIDPMLGVLGVGVTRDTRIQVGYTVCDAAGSSAARRMRAWYG